MILLLRTYLKLSINGSLVCWVIRHWILVLGVLCVCSCLLHHTSVDPCMVCCSLILRWILGVSRLENFLSEKYSILSHSTHYVGNKQLTRHCSFVFSGSFCISWSMLTWSYFAYNSKNIGQYGSDTLSGS